MPLIDFIRTHDGEIIDEFEAFARTLAPPAAYFVQIQSSVSGTTAPIATS